MPFAVTIAAWVTYRPDARLTWLMALPFFALATMFTLNFDSIHLAIDSHIRSSPAKKLYIHLSIILVLLKMLTQQMQQ